VLWTLAGLGLQKAHQALQASERERKEAGFRKNPGF
jgi:hypothetical protein